ncbi:MAG: patatin-like phospholipase family protein [Muribaculaceae bacterium]|nr:patatin-like phospholipase family protein [Muribaculaceae bacterium]
MRTLRIYLLAALLLLGICLIANAQCPTKPDAGLTGVHPVLQRLNISPGTPGHADSIPDRRLVLEAPSYPADSLMALPDVSQSYRKGDYKVGLVLSGGGAKGIAHVGVIKALEDNDIPIDCITGTSMGAIIGSLYSIGMSPAEMMAFLKSPVFLNCSTGTLDPSLVYYFSQPTPTPAWASVNLALKDSANNNITGQIIPSSLIDPLPMNIEFLQIYAPYTSQCGENFDNLMVPYRCVTSDVYHKHKIVLDRGDLGRAVRASMSFPLVFRPIEMDGVLVYDGGIYDNFPVDVMQEDFDPDFIIGVSVSGPDGKPERNNVLSQLEDMIIQNNDYSVPSKNGIKIQCPVLNFGVLDFGQAEVIYQIGYKTGLSMVDSIKSRISSRRSLEAVTARRREFASRTPILMMDSVAVQSGTPGQKAFLRFLFNRGFPDRPFGMEQMQDAYYRAISGGKLRNLMPVIEFGDVDPADPLIRKDNTLVLQPEIKSPWNIGVGGWLTTGTQSMLYLDLGYHTLSFNSLDVDLSGWVGQSYYAGMLSGKFTVHSRMPAYVKLEGVLSNRKFYNSQLMFYQDNAPTFITDIERFIKLHYCLATGRKSVATASLAYGEKRDKFYPYADDIDFSADKRDVSRTKVAALDLGWEYNTLNDAMYPMSGRQMKADILGEWQSASYTPQGDADLRTSYPRHYKVSAEALWRHYFPISKAVRIGGYARGLVTFGPLYRTYTAEMVQAPAFSPTPSTSNYFNPRFRSDNYVAAGVNPIWNPVDKLQLRGDFYGYVPIRDITCTTDGMARHGGWFAHPGFIGEVAAVYNFPFASLSVYGNYLSSPHGNWHFGVSFGLFFLAPRLTR